MENKSGQIGNITAVLMIGTALLVDGIQTFLTLILIGPFINWLISILTWMTFFLWLTLSGVNFMQKPKLFFTLSGGGLCEVIPLVASLPGWTATITTIIFMTKVKAKIKKLV